MASHCPTSYPELSMSCHPHRAKSLPSGLAREVFSSCQFLLHALLVIVVTGCNPSYQKETAPVHGTVTLDGKPVSAGGVSFRPAAGRGAGGVIAVDGTYTLGTYTKSDGAIVGKHKVAISPPEQGEEVTDLPAGSVKLPKRYHNSESSGLEVEVQPNQENVIDLKLTSQP